MRTRYASSRLGFTLIELLVVIAIIGLLSSVVLASLNSARVKARDATRISQLKQINLALALYRDNTGSYPICASAYVPDDPCLGNALSGAGFLTAIPIDPLNTGSTKYRYWGSANQYGLRVLLEKKPLRFSHTYPGTSVPASCDGVAIAVETTWYWYMDSVYPNATDCNLQWVQYGNHP